MLPANALPLYSQGTHHPPPRRAYKQYKSPSFYQESKTTCWPASLIKQRSGNPLDLLREVTHSWYVVLGDVVMSLLPLVRVFFNTFMARPGGISSSIFTGKPTAG
jgi:hypothetical protein